MTTYTILPQALLLSAAALGAHAAAVAQSTEAELPQVITTYIEQTYPEAEDLEWELEEGIYMVELEHLEREIELELDSVGTLLETEVEIPLEELPSAAMNTLTKKYKAKKIKEAEKITDREGAVSYEVEVKRKELHFDQQGNLLEKE